MSAFVLGFRQSQWLLLRRSSGQGTWQTPYWQRIAFHLPQSPKRQEGLVRHIQDHALAPSSRFQPFA